MIIREFLYVDTDKVRSMLAQLEGGVEEEERTTDKKTKRSEGGVKGFLGHYQEWGDERHVSKALGDLIFPTLEDSLESEGMIRDISQELTDPQYWNSGSLQSENPPGSIVRITSRGSFFDARYVATSFAAFSSAALGFQGLSQEEAPSSRPAKKQQPRPPRTGEGPATASQLEDLVLNFDAAAGVAPHQLRSFIRISRGLFAPGLHLNMFPLGNLGHTIGARLQEGRQYLDSDPDILFARYGTGEQEWTLVGSVGHFAALQESPDFGEESFVSDGKLQRGKTGRTINEFLQWMGAVGFIDLPQHPGFSVIPLAVYRQIPRPTSTAVATTA